MNEDVSRLIAQLKGRSQQIHSLYIEYHSIYHSDTLPIESTGKMYYLRPDRVRSETTVNGKPIVPTRNGTTICRYSPNGKDAWQYVLKDVPQSQLMNFGIVDVTDPFFAVEETTIQFDCSNEQSGQRTYEFRGMLKAFPDWGKLDTRKGFSLRYKPKATQVQLHLQIDSEMGLLLRMTGKDNSGVEIFDVRFKPLMVNGIVDPSLFKIEESTTGYRIVQIKDILISAMDPDYADQPPSLN
jgi:outer membrane lipoprotein-sorting protein